MTIGKSPRKRNPTTGRYKPSAKALEFRKAAELRRAQVADAAKSHRKADAAILDAVIARAEAATARAKAAERAALARARPTEGTPEGDGTATGEVGDSAG